MIINNESQPAIYYAPAVYVIGSLARTYLVRGKP